MSNGYYVRIRGRVHGPFNIDKMHDLVRKGQVGRLHEVSPDGTTWSKSSEFPEVFMMAEKAPGNQESKRSPPTATRTQHTSSEGWHYSNDGETLGPCSFDDLVKMSLRNEITPSSQIWNPESSEWAPASSFPDLIPPQRNHAEKQCPFCAELIQNSAIKCRHCGSMLLPNQPHESTHQSNDLISPPTSPHSPLIMALLSGCCIAGLGQIVLGQGTKGIVCLVGAVFLAIITGGISAFLTWPLFAIDAYLVAKKLQRGLPVGKWEFFPS